MGVRLGALRDLERLADDFGAREAAEGQPIVRGPQDCAGARAQVSRTRECESISELVRREGCNRWLLTVERLFTAGECLHCHPRNDLTFGKNDTLIPDRRHAVALRRKPVRYVSFRHVQQASNAIALASCGTGCMLEDQMQHVGSAALRAAAARVQELLGSDSLRRHGRMSRHGVNYVRATNMERGWPEAE